jgi:hypothetical protein
MVTVLVRRRVCADVASWAPPARRGRSSNLLAGSLWSPRFNSCRVLRAKSPDPTCLKRLPSPSPSLSVQSESNRELKPSPPSPPLPAACRGCTTLAPLRAALRDQWPPRALLAALVAAFVRSSRRSPAPTAAGSPVAVSPARRRTTAGCTTSAGIMG